MFAARRLIRDGKIAAHSDPITRWKELSISHEQAERVPQEPAKGAREQQAENDKHRRRGYGRDRARRSLVIPIIVTWIKEARNRQPTHLFTVSLFQRLAAN
jgi:hypothetical protein